MYVVAIQWVLLKIIQSEATFYY